MIPVQMIALLCCIITTTFIGSAIGTHSPGITAKGPSLIGRNLEGFTLGADCHFAPNNAPFTLLTKQTVGSSGFLTSLQPVAGDGGWEALIRFEIQGDLRRPGGQGLAFWYAKSLKSPREGVPGDPAVFGMANRWNGLGIFVEHDREANANSMTIKAVWNNERVVYNPDSQQPDQNLHFAACKRLVRNSPGPSTLRIKYSYDKKSLIVSLAIGVAGREEQCFVYNNIDIPLGWYAGVSGANSSMSGLVADKIIVHSASVQGLLLEQGGRESAIEKVISPASASGAAAAGAAASAAVNYNASFDRIISSVSSLQSSLTQLTKQMPQHIRSASQEGVEGMGRKLVAETQASHTRLLTGVEARIMAEINARVSRLEAQVRQSEGRGFDKVKVLCWAVFAMQVGIFAFVFRLYLLLSRVSGSSVSKVGGAEKKFI